MATKRSRCCVARLVDNIPSRLRRDARESGNAPSCRPDQRVGSLPQTFCRQTLPEAGCLKKVICLSVCRQQRLHFSANRLVTRGKLHRGKQPCLGLLLQGPLQKLVNLLPAFRSHKDSG